MPIFSEQEIPNYAPPSDDGLAAEHALLARALADLYRLDWPLWKPLRFNTIPSGNEMAAADKQGGLRLVRACVKWLEHFPPPNPDRDGRSFKEQDRHLHTRCGIENLLTAVLHREQPLEVPDVVALLNIGDRLAAAVLRTVRGYLRTQLAVPEIVHALNELADRLSLRGGKDGELAGQLRSLVPAPTDATAKPGRPVLQSPQSAPAGSPQILQNMKATLGMSAGGDSTGPSPVTKELEILAGLVAEAAARHRFASTDMAAYISQAQITSMTPAARGRLLWAAVDRTGAPDPATGDYDARYNRMRNEDIVRCLVTTAIKLSREALFDVLLGYAGVYSYYPRPPAVVENLLKQLPDGPLTEGERFVLHRVRTLQMTVLPFAAPPAPVPLLTALIGDAPLFILVPGDAWADELNTLIAAAKPDAQKTWIDLIKLAASAAASRPSAKWLATAKALLKTLKPAVVRVALHRAFALLPAGKSIPLDAEPASRLLMNAENETALRGLLWLASLVADADIARALGAAALSLYKKIPGKGPRAVKAGNACIYALSAIPGPDALGQLALLKVKVRFGTAQKEIEKAFNAAAEKANLPREEIEELAVPTYGLEEVGERRETLGECTVLLRAAGTHDVSLSFSKADGKPLKSVPAAVKKDFKEDLKDLQDAAKDIAKMLPAQAERLDSLFLQQRSWPLATWRERYLDHPLVGVLARRLIWTFTHGDASHAALWRDGAFVNSAGKIIPAPPDDARVALWHPITAAPEVITAWRRLIEASAIVQPFKQAHREIYLLTDAERATATYSNRFAAHIIRQHQFSALAAARGWKHKLRLMVDDAYPPPMRELPAAALRAEFWVEPVGDNYGVDTNDAGVYLRLATDQVRFYPLDAPTSYIHASGGGYSGARFGTRDPAQPLPLDQIPPLVLSEILRDVDLFVGVASVGNDPAWADGGPAGRHREYWQTYSFGELGATAATRRELLLSLVPKLKFAPRASFSDRFLIIRGDLRTYHIHLGSGNILMAPNDQYLCIVPGQTAEARSDALHLPFEGDRTLSIILSKAFLLANDKAITDPSILSQIRR